MNQNNINDILAEPKKIIPSLSEKEITTIFLEAILAYLKKEIRLEILIEVYEMVKRYKRVILTTRTENIIIEVISLKSINDVLNDILGELTDQVSELT